MKHWRNDKEFSMTAGKARRYEGINVLLEMPRNLSFIWEAKRGH